MHLFVSLGAEKVGLFDLENVFNISNSPWKLACLSLGKRKKIIGRALIAMTQIMKDGGSGKKNFFFSLTWRSALFLRVAFLALHRENDFFLPEEVVANWTNRIRIEDKTANTSLISRKRPFWQIVLRRATSETEDRFIASAKDRKPHQTQHHHTVGGQSVRSSLPRKAPQTPPPRLAPPLPCFGALLWRERSNIWTRNRLSWKEERKGKGGNKEEEEEGRAGDVIPHSRWLWRHGTVWDLPTLLLEFTPSRNANHLK